MLLKQKNFKYISGILLFVIVFSIGFIKMNIVYSSTGLGKELESNKIEFYSEKSNTFSNIKDNSFLKIYEEDYGFDIVLKIFDKEKTFSLQLPWMRK